MNAIRHTPGQMRVASAVLTVFFVISIGFVRADCPAEATRGGCVGSAVMPSEGELESDLLLLVNRDRSRQNLPPLILDGLLSEVARTHSRRMAASGVLSHSLPPSGALENRLAAAGYVYRVARENVARAGTLEAAEDGLLLSAPHQRNLFATDVSHVGLGVVRGAAPDQCDLYVTQIFALPATAPSAEALRESQFLRVEEMRRTTGFRPVRADPLLGRVAADLIDDLTVPLDRERLPDLARQAIRELGPGGAPGIASIALDLQMLRDASDLRVPEQARREGASALGVATREARDNLGRPVVLVLCLIGLRD